MRPSWDSYFMSIADMVSSRATCNRLHAGIVIVKHKRILCTGYNGSVNGLEHCDDVGHLMVEGHCVRTVHAEENAVAQAARAGIALDGATAYINAFPCWKCFKLLANSGIVEIVYGQDYRMDEKVLHHAFQAGIKIRKSEVDGPTT